MTYSRSILIYRVSIVSLVLLCFVAGALPHQAGHVGRAALPVSTAMMP